jgi:hypothetical protein
MPCGPEVRKSEEFKIFEGTNTFPFGRRCRGGCVVNSMSQGPYTGLDTDLVKTSARAVARWNVSFKRKQKDGRKCHLLFAPNAWKAWAWGKHTSLSSFLLLIPLLIFKKSFHYTFTKFFFSYIFKISYVRNIADVVRVQQNTQINFLIYLFKYLLSSCPHASWC